MPFSPHIWRLPATGVYIAFLVKFLIVSRRISLNLFLFVCFCFFHQLDISGLLFMTTKQKKQWKKSKNDSYQNMSSVCKDLVRSAKKFKISLKKQYICAPCAGSPSFEQQANKTRKEKSLNWHDWSLSWTSQSKVPFYIIFTFTDTFWYLL